MNDQSMKLIKKNYLNGFGNGLKHDHNNYVIEIRRGKKGEVGGCNIITVWLLFSISPYIHVPDLHRP